LSQLVGTFLKMLSIVHNLKLAHTTTSAYLAPLHVRMPLNLRYYHSSKLSSADQFTLIAPLSFNFGSRQHRPNTSTNLRSYVELDSHPLLVEPGRFGAEKLGSQGTDHYKHTCLQTAVSHWPHPSGQMTPWSRCMPIRLKASP